MSPSVRCDGSHAENGHSLDEILELLSNYQRRAILTYLRDRDGTVHSIDDVIAHLRDVERERLGDSPGEDHLLSVLVHIHGPKLEEAGIATYDVQNMEIRYVPNEQVERMLDEIEATDGS